MARQNKTNLSTLGSQLTKELNQIRVKNSEKAKEIALRVLDVATNLTVVDTAKAVSNWQVSLDNPIEGGIPANVKFDREASIVVAKADARDELRNKKVGQSIFIVNNAESVAEFVAWNGKSYTQNANLLEAEEQAYTEGLTLAAVANQLAGEK
jgi:hypothetical protein